MNLRTFLAFVAPSVLAMLLLIALPLGGVVYLALYTSRVETRLVEVKTEVPLFGGLTRTETQLVSQAVLDGNGRAVRRWEFVGPERLVQFAQVRELWAALTRDRPGESGPDRIAGLYRDVTNLDFWSALEFTLLYTFATTPFVLGFGLLLALAVNNAASWLKGTLISLTLLPMIVTPVVLALSIYWLFLDNAVVAATLEWLGFGQIYFLKDALTIRTLIIVYGIIYATPFAFIILYAGLQTVPHETIEAATIDGASRWQALRHVVIPHLAPLFAVITLVHLMDAYRVFEPVYVFGSRVYANSLQHLTFYVLAWEDNIHKAAAYALLTLAGILVLLVPVLRRVWREQKAIAA